MTDEFKMEKCSKCKECKMIFKFLGRSHYGCFHDPYKGKHLAEIDECPKEEMKRDK